MYIYKGAIIYTCERLHWVSFKPIYLFSESVLTTPGVISGGLLGVITREW